ncbi:BcpO-related WXXGXW repeat protein [Massilia forsythiae]|uniref:BcpO-related WXXGXW repeat protein n=1 Tax=Massilia forsythiae TaxID=2728020 RepID=A0A7Z2ZUL7_9BURK|nr:YXWGXW repeat-containing protein [Massilia forsythiae]QJE02683.1 BcpO-related WXXGXW repeat protein [Massilia forsythiae]
MKSLTLAALIALGAATAPLPSLAAGQVNLFIDTAPPAPLVERIPAPRHGYVWAPGHWEWNGRRHTWARGYWIAERPGYVYSAPSWYARNGGWYMEPARWTPYGRDRNRDGIPDRYEYRGGPGRWDGHGPDRHDRPHGWRDGGPDRHDRDGDGVPNRYDHRPDNPYRR